MVGAIFCFASMDAVAKYLMQEIGAAQTIWARYTVQAVLVTILIFPRINVYARTTYPKLQLSRSIALMMATTLFFFAISKLGLAEATARAGIAALEGLQGPMRESLIYGAAIYLQYLGIVTDPIAAAKKVRAVLDSGEARRRFELASL